MKRLYYVMRLVVARWGWTKVTPWGPSIGGSTQCGPLTAAVAKPVSPLMIRGLTGKDPFKALASLRVEGGPHAV